MVVFRHLGKFSWGRRGGEGEGRGRGRGGGGGGGGAPGKVELTGKQLLLTLYTVHTLSISRRFIDEYLC